MGDLLTGFLCYNRFENKLEINNVYMHLNSACFIVFLMSECYLHVDLMMCTRTALLFICYLVQ